MKQYLRQTTGAVIFSLLLCACGSAETAKPTAQEPIPAESTAEEAVETIQQAEEAEEEPTGPFVLSKKDLNPFLPAGTDANALEFVLGRLNIFCEPDKMDPSGLVYAINNLYDQQYVEVRTGQGMANWLNRSQLEPLLRLCWEDEVVSGYLDSLNNENGEVEYTGIGGMGEASAKLTWIEKDQETITVSFLLTYQTTGLTAKELDGTAVLTLREDGTYRIDHITI